MHTQVPDVETVDRLQTAPFRHIAELSSTSPKVPHAPILFGKSMSVALTGNSTSNGYVGLGTRALSSTHFLLASKKLFEGVTATEQIMVYAKGGASPL